MIRDIDGFVLNWIEYDKNESYSTYEWNKRFQKAGYVGVKTDGKYLNHHDWLKNNCHSWKATINVIWFTYGEDALAYILAHGGSLYKDTN